MTFLQSPQSLMNARLQLHYAIQPIAAVGTALALPQADGRHASLTWDAQRNGFVGHEIQVQQNFRVALDPVELVLQVVDGQGCTLAELPLHQQTLAQAMAWLKAAIALLGADISQVQLLSYPPDDFPDHPIAHGAKFDAADPDSRATLVNYYAISDPLLQNIASRTDGSPVSIWSHHFDIATLIIRSNQTDGYRSIGIGLSPGDTSYPEPYWYVGPYPYPAQSDLPDLAGTGIWHTQGWTGAVLTASMLDQKSGQGDRIDLIQTFLNRAIEVLW